MIRANKLYKTCVIVWRHAAKVNGTMAACQPMDVPDDADDASGAQVRAVDATEAAEMEEIGDAAGDQGVSADPDAEAASVVNVGAGEVVLTLVERGGGFAGVHGGRWAWAG